MQISEGGEAKRNSKSDESKVDSKSDEVKVGDASNETEAKIAEEQNSDDSDDGGEVIALRE